MNRRQVVVITGASAGVGRAVARAFAEDGAAIGLIARGADGLEAARNEVEALGGKALALSCDVADADAIERAALIVEQTFGPIDVWINNAMTTVFAPVVETKPEEYKRVTEVTYLGTVHGTLAALKRMQERDAGHIIQVGSALAFRSIPLQSAYCAAKHAMHGFTESLRSELLHDESKVSISEVHLPAVNTPQFRWSLSKMPRMAQPVPPIYQPEVIAAAIVYVAKHPRRTFLIAPSTMKAVFGNKVAPGYIDKYLAKHGFDAQMTDELANPDQMNNLWKPVAGDHGAHGVFDQRARKHSLQAWSNRNRGWLGLAAVVVGGFALLRRVLRSR
jgi:NADP-dependent 3-hydroxy acid dehydrogenase YdfG